MGFINYGLLWFLSKKFEKNRAQIQTKYYILHQVFEVDWIEDQSIFWESLVQFLSTALLLFLLY